jgi:hypothetical protein
VYCRGMRTGRDIPNLSKPLPQLCENIVRSDPLDAMNTTDEKESVDSFTHLKVNTPIAFRPGTCLLQLRIVKYQSPVFGWHITNHRVYTWITMEAFSDANSEVDKDSVKYRFLHPDASAVSRRKRSSCERVCKIREGLATLAQARATKYHTDEVVCLNEKL